MGDPWGMTNQSTGISMICDRNWRSENRNKCAWIPTHRPLGFLFRRADKGDWLAVCKGKWVTAWVPSVTWVIGRTQWFMAECGRDMTWSYFERVIISLRWNALQESSPQKKKKGKGPLEVAFSEVWSKRTTKRSVAQLKTKSAMFILCIVI